MEGWVDLRGWLYVEMVLCQQSPIQVATWQPLDRESIPRLLVQRTIRPPKYVSRLTVVWRFIELSTVDSLTCAVSTQDAVLARSQNLSRTLYQTESLELLRLNYHHSNATFLDSSALLLLSYVRVTAGFSTFTRPASLQAWQMFARTVEWQHTPLNICSTALLARRNSQLKTYGTIQMRWLIFSSSTTADKRRGAVGYNNNNRISSRLYRL